MRCSGRTPHGYKYEAGAKTKRAMWEDSCWGDRGSRFLLNNIKTMLTNYVIVKKRHVPVIKTEYRLHYRYQTKIFIISLVFINYHFINFELKYLLLKESLYMVVVSVQNA